MTIRNIMFKGLNQKNLKKITKQLLQVIELKSQQDACAYKFLQDGRFGKIEQEHLARSCKHLQDPSYARQSKMILQVLARPMFGKIEQEYLSSTCKINQDLCLARLSKMVFARYCKNEQDQCFARLSKIEQDFLARFSKIQQD